MKYTPAPGIDVLRLTVELEAAPHAQADHARRNWFRARWMLRARNDVVHGDVGHGFQYPCPLTVRAPCCIRCCVISLFFISGSCTFFFSGTFSSATVFFIIFSGGAGNSGTACTSITAL